MADGSAWLRQAGAPPARGWLRADPACGGCGRLGGPACQLVSRSLLVMAPDDRLHPLLAGSGLRLCPVAGGDEALALIRQGRVFDLLLAWLAPEEEEAVTPIRLLRALRPWLPVLLLADHLPPATREALTGAGDGPTAVLTGVAAERETLLDTIGRLLMPRCDPPG